MQLNAVPKGKENYIDVEVVYQYLFAMLKDSSSWAFDVVRSHQVIQLQTVETMSVTVTWSQFQSSFSNNRQPLTETWLVFL